MKFADIKEKQQFSSNDVDGLAGNAHKRSKPYSAPVLKALGKLSTVTLGGSPGVADSGSETTLKTPGT